MTRLRIFLFRLWALVRSRQMDREIDDEITSHLAEATEEYIERGLSPEDAHSAALRSFGGVTQTKEAYRQIRSFMWLDNLRQDVRVAMRGLRKTPGFAVVAIGTLALGIGANTALFSIFSTLILRPLPVHDPGSLTLLTNGSWSYPIWEEIRAREHGLFDGAFAWASQRFDLSPSGKSDLVDGAYVSGRLFDVLGVTAIRGRMITPADDGGAAPDGPVAVISPRLWRQRFAGANDVVGRRLTVQRVPFTVVGVMPPGFFGPDVGRMTDVMVPFAAEPLIRGQESWLTSAGSWWLQIMVRLKPEQSLDQANAALRVAQPQIVASAMTIRRAVGEPLTLAPAATGNSSLRTRFETPLFAMVVAVGLVLDRSRLRRRRRWRKRWRWGRRPRRTWQYGLMPSRSPRQRGSAPSSGSSSRRRPSITSRRWSSWCGIRCRARGFTPCCSESSPASPSRSPRSASTV
jgi:putative ABC transport system permease protein